MLKVQEIRELIKLIDQSSIDEFTYESNGTSVTMKKSKKPIQQEEVLQAVKKVEGTNEVHPVSEAVLKQEVEKQLSKEEAKINETETKEEEKSFDYEIVSPMVGTFYASPSPDSDPYVQIGSKVNKDSVVCIVEAMKLFNEIEAEVSGEIVDILVENGQLVEYGQALFRVKTK